jgi:NAD(P)-dependent dehydrogenase (short-subunit alcohol dehydrogenase family)
LHAAFGRVDASAQEAEMTQQDDGRIAVVTGASKGIGLACTQGLVEDGFHVVAGATRPTPELDALVAAGSVTFAAVDLSTPTGPAELVQAAGGRVDLLVNNVGATKPRTDGFLAVSDEDWHRSFELNFFAAMRSSRAVLPLMVEAGGGLIANIASVNAFLPDPLVIDYSAAKAALVSFAKSLSKEFGPAGVRVITIDPGPVATDLWLGSQGMAKTLAATSGREADAIAADAVSGSATKRFTTPQEIAHIVRFVASGRTPNLTGATIGIDGGLVPTI